MVETSAGRSDIDYMTMSVPGMSAACGDVVDRDQTLDRAAKPVHGVGHPGRR
jgi:hypothetical protein